ncbi:MAG: Flp pilus assembly protein CpaB [Hyphomonadaceae bacterium]|nr:Flp pilus assembly protein CpaB [Hyphomonadaceae bacterium]
MRLVTMISLGVSALLGLSALLVAKIYLPTSSPVPSDKQPAFASRPVVVATRVIKFGERLSAGSLTVVRLPAGATPDGAYSSIEALLALDHGGAPVALTPIAAREAILPPKLSGPGARASVAAEIAEGMRAYTIKVTDVSGVGGHALPGDRVDVVLMRNLAADQASQSLESLVVLQNVRVLGVDLNADLSSTKPISPSTATLEVSVKDAQKLAVAASVGDLSLALRRSGGEEIVDVSPLRVSDVILRGGSATYRPKLATGRSPSARRPSPIIEVVEGEGGQGDTPKAGA